MLDKDEIRKFFVEHPQVSDDQSTDFVITLGLVELRESIDKYTKHRIESDKVLEGLLNDICAEIGRSSDKKNENS